MDQKSKDQIVAALSAEYRETVRQTAEQDRRNRNAAFAQRSVKIAYLLWLLLGQFGAHRFYLGRPRTGIAMAALTLVGGILSVSLSSDIAATLSQGQGQDQAQDLVRAMAHTLAGFALLLPAGAWWLLDCFLIPGMMPERARA